MPPEVVEDFARQGTDWCEARLPGSRELLRRYETSLPERVEQHGLSEAKDLLGWEPQVDFVAFLRDLQARDARGEDVRSLWAPGQIPE